jgi:hypothetical protein
MLCGCLLRVHIYGTARINKRSMSLKNILTAADRRCPECGEEVHQVGWKQARLAPEDAAKVAAYRDRKWPELKQAATGAAA